MKELFRKVVIIFVLAFFLGAALNLLINNPYTHKVIRGAFEEKLRQHTNLRVDFEAMAVSLFPLKATLYGVQIEPATEQVAQNLISVSHIQIYGSWWNLLFGYNKIKKLHFHDLEARWPPPANFARIFKDKEDKDPAKKKSGSEGPIWPPEELPFESIVLSNSRFAGEFSPDGKENELFYFEMLNLNLELFFHRWTRVDLRFLSENTKLYQNRRQILSNALAKGKLSLKGTEIEGSDLILRSGLADLAGSITGSLQIENKALKSIVIKSHWNGMTDLRLLGSWQGIPSTYGPIQGFSAISLLIPLAGHSDRKMQFLASGQAHAEDASLNGLRLTGLGTDYVIDREGITLEAMRLKPKGESLATGSGKLSFGEKAPFKFKMNLKSLTLSQLLNVFDTRLKFFDFNLTGEGIVLKGQSRPFKMQVEDRLFSAAFTSRVSIISKSPRPNPLTA